MRVTGLLLRSAVTAVVALTFVSLCSIYSSRELAAEPGPRVTQVRIFTQLTPAQIEGLGAAVRQIQDEIPHFAYHIMENLSCMEELRAGIREAEWDVDIETLNRAMHETGCFDRYTNVYLVRSTAYWPPPLEIMLVDPATLYVKIGHFFFLPGDIATELLALGVLDLDGIERVVLDLRNNPGGRIDAGMDLLKFFPQGNIPLQRQMRQELQVIPIESHQEQFSRSIELVVLVDHMTASIAEVVAGVLAATYPDALVIGERTYGKGLMQNILSEGPLQMVYTTGEYILPGGEQIQGRGIEPTLADAEILACGTPLCMLERVDVLTRATLAAH